MIFNAGVSKAGQAFIASSADYAFFAVTDDLDAVKSTVRQLGDQAARAGRDPRTVNLAG